MNNVSGAPQQYVVDSHCHLDFPDFEDDFPEILKRAKAAGVGRMVTICTRVRKFEPILAIAKAHDELYCSVGTHPHNADEETDITAAQLVELTDHPKVVAIGEAGLDYHYGYSTPQNQAAGLRAHIDAARQTGLPLVIHSRDADDDMAAILREEMRRGAFKAILHCFSSGPVLANAGIELGLYISFSGILTFKKAEELREIARQVPTDRLLVETDAPYLAPVPHRGQRNEPAFVAHTAEVLASTIGVEYSRICKITTDNFFRCFDKVPDPRDP